MIFIVCLVIALCFFVSQSEIHRALYWWNQRRSRQLQQKAEGIREGLLQELFCCRRSLELQLLDYPETSIQSLQSCLTKIEELHRAIEQLSYDLSPPYVDESLPLAVQHLLEQWRKHISKFNFEIELPSFWKDEPDRNQVILTTLDELLQLTLMENRLEKPIYVSLQADQNIGKLTVHITYSDPSALMASSRATKHFKYLSRSFQLLAFGQCRSRKQGLTMTWSFRWQLHSVAA